VQDPAGVVEHAVDEPGVGAEAGVVHVVDVVSSDGVAVLVGAAAAAARLVVASVSARRVADAAIPGHPQAGAGM